MRALAHVVLAVIISVLFGCAPGFKVPDEYTCHQRCDGKIRFYDDKYCECWGKK